MWQPHMNSLDSLGMPPRTACCPQYEADSAPAVALKATIDRTEKRFANYAKAGLLCGADGLPHLISDPGLALKYGHAGEVFVSNPACHAARARAPHGPADARGQWQQHL